MTHATALCIGVPNPMFGRARSVRILPENGKEKTDRWCCPGQNNGRNKLKHASGCPCNQKDPDDPTVDNRGGPGRDQGRKFRSPLQEAVENNAEVMRLVEQLEPQQATLNEEIAKMQVFKDIQQTRRDLVVARERASVEAEMGGDLVKGLVPEELGESIEFLSLLELGRMGVASSIFQSVEPDIAALSFFTRLLTTRVVC